jgi:hypothetical protein
LQPRCDHKKKPSVGIASTKPPILPSSTSPSLLFSLRLVLGQPVTSPSLLSSPIPAKQVVPPSSSTTSRRSSEVGREKNSSHTATHDSVLGGVRAASLNAGRDVSLHHKWNLSAFSFSCTHSSPTPSRTTLRKRGVHHVSFVLAEFSVLRSVFGYVSLPL